MARKDSSKGGTGGVTSAGVDVSAAPGLDASVMTAGSEAERRSSDTAPTGCKDLSSAGTGGIRSAGVGVSAARGRTLDAAAVPAVRKDERRPPYSGPRRGGARKGIHPLKGLIAPNYVRTGVFLKPDLLDLMDSASWRHPHTQNYQDLRGAALCAMIACCGATMSELSRIQCSHWLPGNRDEVELSGVRLQRHARTMPVLAFAKLVIDPYNRQVKRATGVTALFVGDDGLPATAAAMVVQFKWMTSKNGIPVDSLSMALHKAFEAWARTDEGPMMRALTGRVQRKWLAPDPKFEIEEMREALEIVHPLAPLDREEMLQWKGPYARRYPNPHFPALSRQARTEYEFALKTGGGTAYGAELRDAVRTALDSGKLVAEVAANYGMNISYVQDVRDGKIGETDITLRIRPLQLSLMQFMRSDPPPNVEEVRAWAQEHDMDLSLQAIRKFARKRGVALARSPRFRLHGHEEALLSRMRQESPPSAEDLRVWALAERGIDLGLALIWKFARKRGVVLGRQRQRPLQGHEDALLSRMRRQPPPSVLELQTWAAENRGVDLGLDVIYRFGRKQGVMLTKPAPPQSPGDRDDLERRLEGHKEDLMEQAKKVPDANASQLAAWLLTERGVEIGAESLQGFLLACGWTKPAKSVLNGYTQAVRDLVAANPDITYKDITSWLSDRGVQTGSVGVIYAMNKAGIGKLSQTQSAKKARAATRR